MKLLTEKDVEAIESVLAKGYRVELIPVKDGIRIMKLIRKTIKLNNRKPTPNGLGEETEK